MTDLSSFSVLAKSTSLEYHVATSLYTTQVLGRDVRTKTGERNDPETYNAAKLTAADAQKGVYVAIFPTTSNLAASTLSLSTVGPLQVQSQAASQVRSIDSDIRTDAKEAAYEFTYDYARAHLWMQPGQGTVNVTGNFSLYIWSATVTVEDTQGHHEFKAGKFRTNETPATHEENEAWIVATLTDATLSFTISEPQVRVYSDALAVTVHGTLRVDDASGQFQSDRTQYSPQGDAVRLQGALSLGFTPTPAANPAAPGISSPSPRIRASISGDLTALPNIQGVPIGAPSLGFGTGTVVVAAGAASAIAVGAGIWSGWLPALWSGLPLVAGYVVAYKERLFDFPKAARRRQGTSEYASRLRVLESERSALAWEAKDAWYSPWFALFYCARALKIANPDEKTRCQEACAHYLLRVGWAKKAEQYLVAVQAADPSLDHAAWELARARALLSRGWFRRSALKRESVAALERAISQDRHFLTRALGDSAFARVRLTPEFCALARRREEAAARPVVGIAK